MKVPIRVVLVPRRLASVVALRNGTGILGLALTSSTLLIDTLLCRYQALGQLVQDRYLLVGLDQVLGARLQMANADASARLTRCFGDVARALLWDILILILARSFPVHHRRSFEEATALAEPLHGAA